MNYFFKNDSSTKFMCIYRPLLGIISKILVYNKKKNVKFTKKFENFILVPFNRIDLRRRRDNGWCAIQAIRPHDLRSEEFPFYTWWVSLKLINWSV